MNDLTLPLKYVRVDLKKKRPKFLTNNKKYHGKCILRCLIEAHQVAQLTILITILCT